MGQEVDEAFVDIENDVFKKAQSVLLDILKSTLNSWDCKDALYHYTSPTGLKGILSGSELWFTKIDYLNDQSELNYIYITLEEAIDKGNYHPDFSKHIKNEFIENKEKIKSDTVNDYYVFSLSKAKDELSIWNYYMKNEDKAGYNIEFDAALNTFLKDSEEISMVMTGDVIYGFDAQVNLWDKVLPTLNDLYVENIEECSDVHSMAFKSIRCTLLDVIAMCGAFIKHKAFSHEKERRIIGRVVGEQIKRIEIREDKGIFIPYIAVPFEKKFVKSITISPYIQLDLKIESIKMLLNRYEYEAKCEVSDVPIRF